MKESQVSDRENLSVALRFVDWFARRGEVYEGNIHIIEKHLGKLADRSLPTTNSILPYDNYIRNQPNLHTYVNQYRQNYEGTATSADDDDRNPENMVAETLNNISGSDGLLLSADDPTYLNWS